MGFIIAKLLAFLPLGNLLKGLSGKMILYAGIALFVVFLVWSFKEKIKNQVEAVFKQQQLEDTLVFQRQEISRLTGIEAERNRAIEKAIKTNEELILFIDKTKRKVRSDAFTPTTATPILQEAIRSISEFENKEQETENTGKTKNSAITAWNSLKKSIGGRSD